MSEKPVIIVDEFADVEADDPTFAGMRQDPLEEAAARLTRALREMHLDRYRHAPPKRGSDILAALVDELDLPHEQELARLLEVAEEGLACGDEERARLLAAVETITGSE